MKALLRTRCGCTRMIDIRNEMKILRVPLVVPAALYIDDFGSADPQTEVREFMNVSRTEVPGGSESIHIFEERKHETRYAEVSIAELEQLVDCPGRDAEAKLYDIRQTIRAIREERRPVRWNKP